MILGAGESLLLGLLFYDLNVLLHAFTSTLKSES